MRSDEIDVTGVADARRLLLAELLAAEGLDEPGVAPIPRRRGNAPAPLSFAQEVVWLLDRASSGGTSYNVSVARRIRGPISIAALQDALDALAARHEILRTIFVPAGDSAVQIVQAPARVATAIEDLRSTAAGAAEAAALDALRQHADRPFDLGAEVPFRAVIARVTDVDTILMLLTHHIASDAWSYTIMFDELARLYAAAAAGEPAGLPPVPLQFGDVAEWQRTFFRGDELARRAAYWRERLAGITPLDLPTDRPAPVAAAHPGAIVTHALAASAVHALAEQHGVTPYCVLLAAWQTLLHRYTGQHDIVVGSAVAGRTRTELEAVLGYFSQALPMRTSFDGDPTFAELLVRVSETVLGAFDHQDVPLDALVERDGRTAPAPLFRSVLTMPDGPAPPLRFGAATTEPVTVDTTQTKFDLTLFPSETGAEVQLTLAYRRDAFDEATAARMLRHLERILTCAGDDASRRVSQLRLLTAAERADLAAWNATERAALRREPVHVQVAACAARTPDALAVRSAERSLTYRELDARANRLARDLRSHGVVRGDRVLLGLDRSIEGIVGLLGILKAGAAYVPLAPDAPAERRTQIVAQAGIRVAVAAGADAERFAGIVEAVVAVDADRPEIGAAAAVDDVPVALDADDLAYVVFTSGSTGVPKGVCVTHGNLAAYSAAVAERLELDAGRPRVFATVSTLAADLGNTAIFPALTGGGTLVVVPAEAATDPAGFARALGATGIDILKITPSHLRALLDAAPEKAALLPREWLVLGGERCPWPLAERVLRSAAAPRLLNHYGPTEATVGASTFEVTAESMAWARARGARSVPIGRPLANVQLCVRDAAGDEAALGVPGELFIAGAGVARGYLGRADLTAERFVDLAEIGRAYRTGDRVRRLAGGDLEFLGRVDRQVKIRGFRVELGEIEAALSMHPGVASAVAIVRGEDDEAALAAYVVAAAPGDEGLVNSVRAHLAARLPDAFVPATIAVLETLPLTANGKIDYHALPAPGTPSDTPAYIAPSTPSEVALAAIWADVLGCERVGAGDDFFALGGHSLSAIRVLGKISRHFGVRLPLRALFDTPVLRSLAAVVTDGSGPAASVPAPTIAPAPRGRRPAGGANP